MGRTRTHPMGELEKNSAEPVPTLMKNWDHLLGAQNVHRWLEDPVTGDPQSLALSTVGHRTWRAGLFSVYHAFFFFFFNQSGPWKSHTTTDLQVQTSHPTVSRVTVSRTDSDALIWKKALMLPFQQFPIFSAALGLLWPSCLDEHLVGQL